VVLLCVSTSQIGNLKNNSLRHNVLAQNIMKYKFKKYKKSSGFTLFIALIVSSLLLAIGFSLSTIILKQLIFSNSGKESQLAFYAADSGAECALYWDRKGVDGYTVFDGAFATSTTNKDIFCGTGGPTTPLTAQVGSFSKISANQLEATTTFYADFSESTDPNNKACAKVTVYKWLDVTQDPPVEHTRIDSRGYNVPMTSGSGSDVSLGAGAVCNYSASDRVVERAVRLDY
jgi:Tfp pilus assembly protein PilX